MRRRDQDPELTPVESAPSMQTLNGCGTMLYGSRDRDPKTNSYVATLCITFLFLPVYALKAYRVTDAPGGGWYFHGRAPLSSFAKGWNLFAVLTACAGLGQFAWGIHTSSPAYIAGQALERAQQHEGNGEIMEASKQYADVLGRGFEEDDCREARTRLVRLVCTRGGECDGAEQLTLLRTALRYLRPGSEQRNLLKAGMEMVEQQRADGNPSTAWDMLHTIARSDKKVAEDEALREGILRECVASSNGHLGHVKILAGILEKRGDEKALEALLAPHASELGDSEAARMLGTIYSCKGELAKAEALLTPYVKGKLGAFRKAEKRYGSALEKMQKSRLNELRQGVAGDAWYKLYDKSDEAKQQEMVDAYISAGLKMNGGVKKALAKLEAEAKVVPFAMDLAIAKLHLAREKGTEAERTATLTEAEELFMAVQGVAGENENFRIFLGQVKYWLGKGDEGKALFEAALEQGERRVDLLLGVAEVMRQIGLNEQARELAEEAYGKGKKEEEKQQAASIRAVIFRDLDDRILWLARAGTDSVSVKASLASALGEKAQSEGRLEEAEKHYLAADRLYRSMPVESSALNNRSLVMGSLYSITSSVKYLDEQIAMLEKSEALNSTHTVIKDNLIRAYFQRAACRPMDGKIDYRLLHMVAEHAHSWLLVKTVAENQKNLKAQCATADFKRLQETGERVHLLAPQSPSGPATLLAIHCFSEDVNGIKQLMERIQASPPEQSRKGTPEQVATHRAQALAANTKRLELLQQVLAEHGKSTTVMPMTQALLRCEIAGLLRENFGLGGEASPAEAISLAGEAYRIHPSFYTEARLRSSCIFAALAALVRKDARAATLWRKYREELDVVDTCLWMFYTEPSLRKKFLADHSFREAVKIYARMAKRGAGEVGVAGWLVLRGTDPELASRVAGYLAADEFEGLRLASYSLLSPQNGETVLNRILLAEACGRPAEAKRLLAEARQRGLAL